MTSRPPLPPHPIPPPPPNPRPPQSPLGADVHALVLRTDRDVIVSYRGMDSRRDVQFMDVETAPVYDAKYFGAEAFAAAAGAPERVNGKPNPEAFWVLDGYIASYEAIRAPVEKLLAKWEAKVGRAAAPVGCGVLAGSAEVTG
jgi:hypothetical protein